MTSFENAVAISRLFENIPSYYCFSDYEGAIPDFSSPFYTLVAHDHRDELKSFALPSVLEENYEKYHDFDDHDGFQLAHWLFLEDGKRELIVSGLIDTFTPNANDLFSIGLFRHLRGIDPGSTVNSLNEWSDNLCMSELILESTVQMAMLSVQTAIEFVKQAKAYLQKDPVKIE